MYSVHERTHPRMSANKLGEYLTASPVRRRRIVKDQKHPPEFQVARYTEAQSAIAEFLVSGRTDDAILFRVLDRLQAASARSGWDAQRIQDCSQAIEAFMDFPEMALLHRMNAVQGDPNPPQLNIADVRISVRPEIILHGSDRLGSPTVGAVKLYIGKSNPLTDESGLYVATILHQFVSEYCSESGKVDLQACAVFDVFGRRFYVAPRSFIRRRHDIEAACEEIARAWPAF